MFQTRTKLTYLLRVDQMRRSEIHAVKRSCEMKKKSKVGGWFVVWSAIFWIPSVESLGKIQLEFTNSTLITGDLTLEVGSQLQLICKADGPITWTLASLPEEFDRLSQITSILARHTVEVRSSSDDNQQESHLSVEGLRSVDTGYFSCNSLNQSKSVYVFVSDPKNFIVHPQVSSSLDYPTFLQVSRTQKSLVPCKLTDPKLTPNISLAYCDGGESPISTDMGCGNYRTQAPLPDSSWSFNPRRGFTVEWAKIPFKSDEMIVLCRANDEQNRKEILKFAVRFTDEYHLIPTPEIRGKFAQYVQVGETFQLNCSVRFDLDTEHTLNWTVPNTNSIKEGRIVEGNQTSYRMTFNKIDQNSTHKLLTVRRAQLADAGTYNCFAIDEIEMSPPAQFQVHVHEGHMNYTKISTNVTDAIKDIDDNVTWVAKIEALMEPDITWLGPNNKPILPSVKHEMRSNATAALLIIRDIGREDSGYYRLVTRVKNQTNTLTFTLFVKGIPWVTVANTSNLRDSFQLTWRIRAFPPATVSIAFRNCSSNRECNNKIWTRNLTLPPPIDVFRMASSTGGGPTQLWPEDPNSPNVTHVRISYHAQVVQVSGIPGAVTSEFLCLACNSQGCNEEEHDRIIIRVKSDDEHFGAVSKKADTGIVVTIVIIAIILIVLLVVLAVKIKKEKARKELFRINQLDLFDKGNPESINPDLPVDEQTELLPYDRKWEFPRDRLKLGKQLGAGAFGRVLKAEAIRIGAEPVTTVAVKMVRAQGNMLALKALMSELKIMIHLGSHLNIVNLLGACTKRVTRGELLVIVEYCRFGNLQNYLIRHRDRFINQLNPSGDVQFGSNEPALLPNLQYDVLRDPMGPMSDYRTATVTFSENTDGTITNSANNNRSDLSEVDSSGQMITSNGQSNPQWRSNYRGDYRDLPTRPVTTQDLICWAFQIARGMTYLTSRKVLHGDLAARNVLLADDNIVKVADFGLAREVYRSGNYKKKGEGPLPVKWMAVESIADRIFSTQSDVWSFGIVLWELFSLGKTPYPGIEADEQFFRRLQDGYRMDKPRFAPNTIYEIMSDCWRLNPSDRPNFSQLEQRLGPLLDEMTRQHYVDLNDSYVQANCPSSSSPDYLNMMADINNTHSSSNPHYLNLPTSEEAQSDYLAMESNLKSAPSDSPVEASAYLSMGAGFEVKKATLTDVL